jgi:Ca2+-binding EF-hand superfamily protein
MTSNAVRIKEIFNSVDVKGDGTLPKATLVKILDTLGMSASEYEHLMDACTDKGDAILYNKFVDSIFGESPGKKYTTSLIGKSGGGLETFL